jgi:hypothetical protein
MWPVSKKTEYERIRDVWYKKLKDEGFEDIEHADGSINSGMPRSFGWNDADLRQLTQDYYCMANHFLNEYEFESELEKTMWDYHTNGLSIRNITKILNDAKVTETNRIRVWKTIKKLEDIMKSLYLSV